MAWNSYASCSEAKSYITWWTVAGMGKPETIKQEKILKQIKNECTVVIVEHDMEFVKMIADM